jgi:uncharacterized membrane protein YccC
MFPHPAALARPAQALRPVCSVAMAVAAAHVLGLQDTWWAAISAFMVMQADFLASALRGFLRMVGTLAGAALGFALGPWVAPHPVAFVALAALGAWAGLYAALWMRFSYAWVLALITFVMVLGEALSLLMRDDLARFALERVVNVAVGTAACIVVAALTEMKFFAALTRHGATSPPVAAPTTAPPAGSSQASRHAAALHALPGAITVALLAGVSSVVHLSSFSQAMVTTVAVLIVPIDGNAAVARGAVMQRMVQRLVGCALAGAVSFAVLPLIDGKPLACQIALGLGVWAGAHLQGGDARWRYAATQFSIAFIMVFVQDHGWVVETDAALQRLAGVFAGIAALFIVFLIVDRARNAATTPKGNA